MASEVAVEKFCVVCGAGSHREDWQGKENPACNSHSKEEIAAALAKAAPPVESKAIHPIVAAGLVKK